MSFEKGDKISVPIAGGLLHYGIVTENNYWFGTKVVHCRKGEVVSEVTLNDFASGRAVTIHERARDAAHAKTIVHRVRQLVGCPYDLINFNCEHLANLAVHGEKFSLQLQVVMGLAMAYGLASLVGDDGKRR